MRYGKLEIPDLPEMAFQRKPGGGIMPQGGGGKGGSTPKTPDYMALAQQDAQSQLDMAKYATEANRVNQVTPYGSLTYSNDRQFDQAGYDAALQRYQSGQGSAVASNQTPVYTSGRDADGNMFYTYNGKTYNSPPAGAQANGAAQSAGAAPNRDDFYSGGNQWTQTMQLSPEQQALYNQQTQLQQGMFGAQNAALGRVNSTMGSAFNTSGIPQGGQALNLSSLPGMGQATDLNSLPGMGQALNMSSLPGYGQVYDPTQSTNNATELLMQRMNPQLEQQRAQLESRLANQGIAQGSQAWNQAINSDQMGRNDAYTQASLQGINLGMQQQGQTYGQQTQNQQLAAALQAQQFGQQNTNRQQEANLSNMVFGQQNGLRQQEAGLQGQQFNQAQQANQTAYQQAAYERSLPMSELTALMNGTQVQQPQFNNYAQQATTGGANTMGAAQQGYATNLAASNAQQAQSANAAGGLFGLAGTGLGAYLGGPQGAWLGGQAGGALGGLFSDRRLKENIKLIGKADNGLNIYSYRYTFGGPTHIGHMADEVEKVFPEAVGERAGFKTVDYSKV